MQKTTFTLLTYLSGIQLCLGQSVDTESHKKQYYIHSTHIPDVLPNGIYNRQPNAGKLIMDSDHIQVQFEDHKTKLNIGLRSKSILRPTAF